MRHRTPVLRACRRFFDGGSLAEEAAQETFLRAYQSLHLFREGNVCGWLMRIARNVCIDLWRKQRPEAPIEEAELAGRDGPGLDHLTAVNQALAKVRDEMRSLHPDQCRCLELKMDGYSYEETAELTGLSVSAVKSHLQNGRRMLWGRVGGVLSELP